MEIHHNLEDSGNLKGNAVSGLKGYFYFGAGFNVSANKNGCFPYFDGTQVRYFDLSLSDLPYKSGQADSGFSPKQWP